MHRYRRVNGRIYRLYAPKRGKRKKPTSEIQQRLNRRHSEGKLRRLLHTNFSYMDTFATLTFDDATCVDICLSYEAPLDYHQKLCYYIYGDIITYTGGFINGGNDKDHETSYTS